jgi:electron-transferring-flavoprotein dehydrogenase
LVGCDAGYLNAARIKGSHAAIKSGMLCAEAAFEALQAGRSHDELSAYPAAFEKSWLHEELSGSKNFKQWFKKGNTVGAFMTGIEQWLLPKLGLKEAPWTIHRTEADHTRLKPAAQCARIDYPKPDGKLTFDRLSSVFVSNTNHEENQPAHLTLRDASEPLLPCRCLRVREERGWQRPPADQCAELRALQDLRHQGSDAEHRMGHAGRRWWAELRRDVSYLRP